MRKRPFCAVEDEHCVVVRVWESTNDALVRARLSTRVFTAYARLRTRRDMKKRGRNRADESHHAAKFNSERSSFVALGERERGEKKILTLSIMHFSSDLLSLTSRMFLCRGVPGKIFLTCDLKMRIFI